MKLQDFRLTLRAEAVGGRDLHLFIVPIWFNLAVVSLVAVAAYGWGGWRERSIATVMCARWYIGTAAFLWPSWGPFGPPPQSWRALVEGAVLLAVCFLSAARGRSYWVIWAGALAVLHVITDLADAFGIGVSTWAARSAGRIWLYLMSATLLWGVWATARRRASGEPA